MPLRDFIKGFKYDPETFKPDEFIAALTREYDTDESLWSAKITDTEKTVEKVNTENSEMKLQLWDYYVKSGKPIPDTNASGSQVPPVGTEDPNEYQPKGLMNAVFAPQEKE